MAGYTFDEQSVRRIGQAVRRVEAHGLGGGASARRPGQPPLRITLGDEDPSTAGRFTWSLATDASVGQSYSDKPAVKLGSGDAAEGDEVLAWHSALDDGTPCLYFQVGGGGGGGLPAGSGQYKVLQLNASNEPIWDYVRFAP